MKEVYVLFGKRELTCNEDNSEGFIIVWDSDEIGRNLSTMELLKEIEKIDDETYDKILKKIEDDFAMFIKKDFQTLNDNYFSEIFEMLEEELEDSVDVVWSIFEVGGNSGVGVEVDPSFECGSMFEGFRAVGESK